MLYQHRPQTYLGYKPTLSWCITLITITIAMSIISTTILLRRRIFRIVFTITTTTATSITD